MPQNNLYRQPSVVPAAPDAIVFIDSGNSDSSGQNLKRTITMTSSTTGQSTEVDFMNFVESISVSKGIDRVPGEATINVKAPKHALNDVYGSIKDILATMMEIQIYMKGRFLVNGEYPYYPTFWGVISNISEVQTAGDLLALTITCQDMMRWLAITKVNLNVAVINSAVVADITAQVPQSKLDPFAPAPFSVNAQLSCPGVVMNLLNFSTGDNYLLPQNIDNRSGSVFSNGQPQPLSIDNARKYSDQVMVAWQQKFKNIAAAFYVYGYVGEDTSRTIFTGVNDVNLDINAYKYIYGSRIVSVETDPKTGQTEDIDVPFMDIAKAFSFGAAAFNTQEPATFVSNFQNRLDIANEAKNQVHYEFYQDVDGTVVLKPPFYNMDTRENPIYVVEDIDIISMNITEDESQVMTRIDVTGSPAYGMNYAGADANSSYGYAIDFDKLQKYGLRMESIETNFLTTANDAKIYAQNELARRNSLVVNGSMTIQGRPEMKLGYPIYVPSKDAFFYVSGIDHSFSFGGSFDTTLTLTAQRKLKLDPNNQPLKNLLVQCTGSPTVQPDIPGINVPYDENNLFNNVTALCDVDEFSQFVVDRPDYHYKTLDDVLKYQGSFQYFYNQPQTQYDPQQYQQVTDSDGYTLLGNGFPFAQGLVLTGDWRISPKGQESDKSASIASSLRVSPQSGSSPSLSYLQPLTLDQIQNVQVKSQTSSTNIPLFMAPTTSSDYVGPRSSTFSVVPQIFK